MRKKLQRTFTPLAAGAWLLLALGAPRPALAQAAAQAQSASQASAAQAAQQQAQAAQAAAARPAGAPPVGSVVQALPSGCVSAPKGGVEYQNCGGVYYRAAFQGNNLVYVVE